MIVFENAQGRLEDFDGMAVGVVVLQLDDPGTDLIGSMHYLSELSAWEVTGGSYARDAVTLAYTTESPSGVLRYDGDPATFDLATIDQDSVNAVGFYNPDGADDDAHELLGVLLVEEGPGFDAWTADEPTDGLFRVRLGTGETVVGASRFDELDDVDATGGNAPTDGQAPLWDAGEEKWIPGDVAGVSSLPDQTGNDGKVLRTDGTDAQWANLGLVIADAPSKVTPGDNDKFALSDSDDSDVVKRIAFADLAAALASGGTGALPSTTGQTGKVLVVDPDEEPAWHFVQSDAVPQPLGTAAAGTGTGMARDDHVHEMPTASDVGADPAGSAAAAQAAAEAYTDAQLAAATMGWSWKSPVKAVATSDITLSGAQTIDGVSVVAGDRVLVAGQTTGSQNGIYTAASGSWARSTDADTSAEVKAGLAVAAWAGSANGDAVWLLTTDDPITVGTTALAFSKVPMTAGIPLAYLDTDGALAANSDTKVPSQKAVKSYVDGRRLDQAATPTGDVGLGTHKITGLAAGTAATDAANVGQTRKRAALITDSGTRYTTTSQGVPLIPMESAGGVTTTAVAAGALYWCLFDCAEPGTITSFQFSVTATSLSSGQTVDVAMFDIAADNGPGARLWNQSVTVGNTTGTKRVAGLSLARPTRGALAFINPSGNAGSVTVLMAIPSGSPMWDLGQFTANRTAMVRAGVSSMPSDLTSSNFTPSGSDALTQAVPLILGRA